MKNNMLLIQELKTTISNSYNVEHLQVNLLKQDSSTILKISIDDSKFNNYSPKEKQTIANNIGTMALKHKDDLPQITQG
jgi:hypothetical protein